MSNETTEESYRCFHCGEVFMDRKEAAEHFGNYVSSYPICRVDAEKYREMEQEVERWRTESAPLQIEVSSLHAKIAREAEIAEEKGYARGLRDAKKHPQELGLMPILA